MEVAWKKRGFCVGFAWNLILFLFEREHEGYKRFADCTVSDTLYSRIRTRHTVQRKNQFCDTRCKTVFEPYIVFFEKINAFLMQDPK